MRTLPQANSDGHEMVLWLCEGQTRPAREVAICLQISLNGGALVKIHHHECSGCKEIFECDREDCGGKFYQYFSSCNACTYVRMQAFASPRKALALVVIFALLGFPFAQVRAQERQIRVPLPATASHSVFEETGRSFARLQTKQRMGQDTAIDYAVASANLRTMFAHMDETGMTDSVEKYILSNPARFTQFPSEPELQEAFSKVPDDQRKAFVEHIRTGGLKAFHQEMVSLLDLKASAMLRQGETRLLTVQNGGNGYGARSAAPPANDGAGPAGNPGCSNWATYIGWGGMYFGIVAFVTGIGAIAFWIGLGVSYIANVYAC